MKPTAVAVIGCGRIARGEHLPAWAAAAKSGLCKLVGVCDINPELAIEIGATYCVPVFTDAEEMLQRTSPEVVDISTAVMSHRELALMALQSGCHVLCEKPVAMNVGEAREILAAAQRADRLFSICFQYRTWDESRYIRKRIAAGDLGHVHFIRTWGGDVHNFSLHRRTLPGGGVLAHWMIHNLNLALWLLGNPEPLTGSAFCHQRLREYPEALGPEREQHEPCEVIESMEDFASAMVRLEGGTLVTLEANWLQQPLDRPEGWELLGAKGSAAICPLKVRLDRDYQWIDETAAAGVLQPCSYRMNRLMSEFLQAARGGGSAPVAAEEIIRIQRLMDALYASAASGHEVIIQKSDG